MKASDTIMSQERIASIMMSSERIGYEKGFDIAESQAEITWDIAFKAGMKEVVEQVKAQTINAKRNASGIYEAHKQLKPKDKQSKAWHNGYDGALQDLINVLQSKLMGYRMKKYPRW